jgi:hypothetical protein
VWREALGEGCNEAAAYLKPVPPGAVVYGSGDTAVIISKASKGGLLPAPDSAVPGATEVADCCRESMRWAALMYTCLAGLAC